MNECVGSASATKASLSSNSAVGAANLDSGKASSESGQTREFVMDESESAKVKRWNMVVETMRSGSIRAIIL